MNLFYFSDKQKHLGLLILRIGLGVMMFFHGFPKLMGDQEKWMAVGSAMETFGIGFGHKWWGLAAAIAEVFGGLFLILGVYFRATCFVLLFTMIIATSKHYSAGDGFAKTSHPIENGIVFLSLLFIGPGKYSFDERFYGRRERL